MSDELPHADTRKLIDLRMLHDPLSDFLPAARQAKRAKLRFSRRVGQRLDAPLWFCIGCASTAALFIAAIIAARL